MLLYLYGKLEEGAQLTYKHHWDPRIQAILIIKHQTLPKFF